MSCFQEQIMLLSPGGSSSASFTPLTEPDIMLTCWVCWLRYSWKSFTKSSVSGFSSPIEKNMGVDFNPRRFWGGEINRNNNQRRDTVREQNVKSTPRKAVLSVLYCISVFASNILSAATYLDYCRGPDVSQKNFFFRSSKIADQVEI